MKTGMLAAESAFAAIHPPEDGSEPTLGKAADLSSYEVAFRSSWVYDDLHEVRNMRPAFNSKLGLWGGIIYSGIDSLFLKGRTPWTFRHALAGTKEKHQVRSPHCIFVPTHPQDLHLAGQHFISRFLPY